LKDIDIVMLCTGYGFSFPFLHCPELVYDESKVGPLFEDLWFAKDPSLVFIGLAQ
jgi:hypothetical protein